MNRNEVLTRKSRRDLHNGSFRIARIRIEFETGRYDSCKRLTEKIVTPNAGNHPQIAVQAMMKASTTIVRKNLVQPSGVDQ